MEISLLSQVKSIKRFLTKLKTHLIKNLHHFVYQYQRDPKSRDRFKSQLNFKKKKINKKLKTKKAMSTLVVRFFHSYYLFATSFDKCHNNH